MCSTCDTCCSSCCGTRPSVCDNVDSERHAAKLTSTSPDFTEQTGRAHAPSAAGTPSSPFKVFRNSDRRSDTDEDDSLEDSLNTLSRTPPYAGVDVEEVEMTLTEDDGETDPAHTATASTAALQSRRLDKDVKADASKPQLNTGSAPNATNTDVPLLLVAAASNTMDTLFGEVSDTDSNPSYN